MHEIDPPASAATYASIFLKLLPPGLCLSPFPPIPRRQLAETRPDVLLARVSSRACSMAQPLLEDYRERLCHTGYGPYKGLNVPSSGWVAAHMLLQLCTKVSVYGFGVEGMKKASRGLSTGARDASRRSLMCEYVHATSHARSTRRHKEETFNRSVQMPILSW